MGVGGSGRIKRDWSAVFLEFRQSGLTIKEFCLSQGMSQSLFYRRRKDYDVAEAPGRGVQGKKTAGTFGRRDFIELTGASSSRWSASIVFGGGIELLIGNDCDRELLGSITSQLKGCSC